MCACIVTSVCVNGDCGFRYIEYICEREERDRDRERESRERERERGERERERENKHSRVTSSAELTPRP